MNILRLLGKFLLVYFVYRLIVDFIIPTFRGVNQIKGQMRQMQEKMDQQAQNSSQNNAPDQQKPTSKPADQSEYIDFEEVKN